MNGEWLSLSKAAKLLGVHPSTVRNWSDRGVIPVHRTRGGHRRFRRSEVELWMDSRRVDQSGDALTIVQNALKNTRFQINEGKLGDQSWYSKLDDRAKTQYRLSGRALMQGLTSYLSTQEEDISDAEALGYEYASRGQRHGLSSSEVVSAFLFFRNMLIESMLSVYEAAAVSSPYAWSDMFRRLNSFTDHILITLINTFSAYNRSTR